MYDVQSPFSVAVSQLAAAPNPAGGFLVHAKETTVESAFTDCYQSYAVRSHNSEWQSARAAYQFLEENRDLQKLDAFEFCRKVAWFVRHEETGKIRVASKQCHLRWCPMCAQVRSNFISRQVQEWIAGTSYSKFVTLTVKSTDDPIADQINHLYDSFKRLRKKKDWKSKINAGVWFFQITQSAKTGLWHPHLHIIAAGKYFSKRQLSRVWLTCTGDSPIVDIKAVKDKKQAAQYAARYAAKPAALDSMPTSESAALIMALHGRRICGCWGKNCKISFRPKKPDDAESWKNIGDFFYVSNLRSHDEAATAIWECWSNGTALDPKITMYLTEKLIDGYSVENEPEKPPPRDIQTYMDFF